jgi:predicted nucleotidyltransferase
MRHTGHRADVALLPQGYLRVDDRIPGYFCLTSKGLALSSATLRAISRATAAKHLSELLRRVPEICGDPLHAYTVNAVMVFGSFLSEKQKLGDIDVAVHLEVKRSTEDEYRRRLDGLLARAWLEGRTPSNVVDASCWPRLDVFRDLRRSLRQLRLHELYGLQKLGGLECCVVFGDPETVKTILPKARIKASRALGNESRL